MILVSKITLVGSIPLMFAFFWGTPLVIPLLQGLLHTQSFSVSAGPSCNDRTEFAEL